MKNKKILTLILSIIIMFSAVCVYATEPQIVTISENNKFTVSYTNENIKEGSFYSIYVLKPGETSVNKNNLLFMKQVIAESKTIEIADFELKGDAKSGDFYIGGAGLGSTVNAAVLVGHFCPDAEIVFVDAVPPTCTENGTIEHYKCLGCNKMFSDKYAVNIITDITDSATNHSNKEAFHGESNRCDNLKNSDCIYCPDCKKYFTDEQCTDEIEIIANHSPVKNDSVEPTCSQPGNIEYYQCSVCALKFEEEECINLLENGAEIISARHTLTKKEQIAPDCKNNGVRLHWHCIGECGQNFADERGQSVLDSIVIESLGHTWEVQANGREVCSVCSEKKPAEIASGVGVGGGGGGGAATYTVKFETNGAEKIASIKLTEGQTVEKPVAPEKDGYTFLGWFVDEACTKEYDFSQKVINSFTLYAGWMEAVEENETPAENELTYEDVSDSDWFYDAVVFASDNGLMNGVEEGVFAPGNTVTRAMLVTVLYRMENEPSASPSTFTDVEKGSWYANAVAWASSNNITSGVNEKEFAPNSNISREQIATMLYRYAIYKGYNISSAEKTSLDAYTDSNEVADYANSAFKWAVGESIVSGKSETTLNPKDNATRAEMAALLMRICNKYN